MRVLFVRPWRSAIVLSVPLSAIVGALAGCKGNGAAEHVTTQACAGASCAPACEEGAAECRPGNRSASCRDGTWTERSCIIACRSGHCVDCAEGEGRCVDAGTAEICVEGVLVAVPCVEEPCRDARCRCRPQSARCSDSGRQLCNEDGLWMDAPCDSERPLCFDEGRCGSCAAGASRCLGPEDVRFCGEDWAWAQQRCSMGCDFGTGRCRPEACTPGSVRCGPSESVQRCADDGQGYFDLERCDAAAGEMCVEGRCMRSCDVAAGGLAPSGCRFVAPPIFGLVQHPDARYRAGPYVTLHLLNPSADHPAEVRVVQGAAVLAALVLKAEGYAVVEVPSATASADFSARVPSSVIDVRSNRPIYVVQYLSLMAFEGENAMAGDTAFLLPIHLLDAAGTRHRVLTQPHRQNHGGLPNSAQPGGFTVVSTSAEVTQLTIRFSGHTAPGGEDLPAFGMGEMHAIPLGPAESIHFLSQSPESVCPADECAGVPGDNLTGTRIESDRPIGVFNSGMSRVPYAVDHHIQAQVLEQLMPVDLWGDRFVVAARWAPGTDFGAEQWVVVTDESGNALHFAPPPHGVAVLPLPNAGDFAQFNTASGAFVGHRQFEMSSDHPVLMARYAYMPVSNRNRGSSSFSLERPFRFWRTRYDVSSVADRQNHLHLVVPTDAVASLDGSPILEPRGYGPPGYETIEVAVAPGRHWIDASAPSGLIVYGGVGGIAPGGGHTEGQAYSYSGPVGFGDAVGGF